MSRWGRDVDDVRADLAYAFGEGLDPLEELRRQSRVAGGRDE